MNHKQILLETAKAYMILYNGTKGTHYLHAAKKCLDTIDVMRYNESKQTNLKKAA